MKRFLMALFAVLTISITAYADSPLTSTEFYMAYTDVPIIQKALKEKSFNDSFAEYLSNESNPIDAKAALINALSWETPIYDDYKTYLANQYKMPYRNFNIKKLTTDEVFSLAYMKAIGDYFHPEKSFALFKEAQKRAPKSFTIQIVFAIARSQKVFSKDWCKVWSTVSNLLDDKGLTQDRFRPEAVNKIMDYMDLYRDSCYSKGSG